MVQLPAGTTEPRTLAVLNQVERHFLDNEQAVVTSTFTVAGFSFGGSGQSAGMGFIRLKDWSERTGAGQSVSAIQRRAMAVFARIKDAQVFAIVPGSRQTVPPKPTGRSWSRVPGWPTSCRVCVSRMASRRSVPGPSSGPRCVRISRSVSVGCISLYPTGIGSVPCR